MKRYLIESSVILSLAVFSISSLFAQSEKPQSRFSHKGLKAAIGTGTFEMRSGANLNDGNAGLLSLGYGFSSRSTLWLSLGGVEYPKKNANEKVTEFGGVELAYQYKFMPQSRFQPYGKIGLGGYGLHEKGTNLTILGGGFNLGLGADYFFSKHFGVGVELNFKDIEFIRQSETVNGKDIVSDLNPRLNRDSTGFLITLTIQ